MDAEPEDTVVGRLMGFITGCVFAGLWFGVVFGAIWQGEYRLRWRGSRGVDDVASLAMILSVIVWLASMAWAFRENLRSVTSREMQQTNRAQWRADTGSERNSFAGWALILPMMSAGAFLSAFGFGQDS